jgi:hypothetical protein
VVESWRQLGWCAEHLLLGIDVWMRDGFPASSGDSLVFPKCHVGIFVQISSKRTHSQARGTAANIRTPLRDGSGQRIDLNRSSHSDCSSHSRHPSNPPRPQQHGQCPAIVTDPVNAFGSREDAPAIN